MGWASSKERFGILLASAERSGKLSGRAPEVRNHRLFTCVARTMPGEYVARCPVSFFFLTSFFENLVVKRI
jgi:hypothetical protein